MAVPDSGRVILRAGDARVPIREIEHRVGGARYRRNSHPRYQLARNRVVALDFEIEGHRQFWIRKEGKICRFPSFEMPDPSPIAQAFEMSVCLGHKNGKVHL